MESFEFLVGRYNRPEQIRSGPVQAFRAQNTANGRSIFIHRISTAEAPEEQAAILKLLTTALVRSTDVKRLVLDFGEEDGYWFVVTDSEPQCALLREWLQEELGAVGHARAATKTGSRDPGEFTRFIESRAAATVAIAALRLAPLLPVAGEFKSLFSATDSERQARLQASPATLHNPPRPPPAPVLEQGEATRLFESEPAVEAKAARNGPEIQRPIAPTPAAPSQTPAEGRNGVYPGGDATAGAPAPQPVQSHASVWTEVDEADNLYDDPFADEDDSFSARFEAAKALQSTDPAPPATSLATPPAPQPQPRAEGLNGVYPRGEAVAAPPAPKPVQSDASRRAKADRRAADDLYDDPLAGEDDSFRARFEAAKALRSPVPPPPPPAPKPVSEGINGVYPRGDAAIAVPAAKPVQSDAVGLAAAGRKDHDLYDDPFADEDDPFSDRFKAEELTSILPRGGAETATATPQPIQSVPSSLAKPDGPANNIVHDLFDDTNAPFSDSDDPFSDRIESVKPLPGSHNGDRISRLLETMGSSTQLETPSRIVARTLDKALSKEQEPAEVSVGEFNEFMPGSYPPVKPPARRQAAFNRMPSSDLGFIPPRYLLVPPKQPNKALIIFFIILGALAVLLIRMILSFVKI